MYVCKYVSDKMQDIRLALLLDNRTRLVTMDGGEKEADRGTNMLLKAGLQDYYASPYFLL